jgi:uncharacterized protein YqjF (DUF2071 family)
MLAMLNYAIDPALLRPLVPRGTELDFFGGKCYVSLVGFRFLRTRVCGLRIPFHSDFDEVNLRFYVRREAAGEVRRGVVFVREIGPRMAIAKVARWAYGERYVALPMAHRIAGIDVEYRWRLGGNWNSIAVCGEGTPGAANEGSLEQFITEHYWGYAAQRDGRTREYRVEHERWRVWQTRSAKFTGECSAIYGADLARCLRREPDSAFLADGSAVVVHRPGVLS